MAYDAARPMVRVLCLILFAGLAVAQALPQQAEQALDGTWTFFTADGTSREVQLPCGFEDHEGLAFDGGGRYERTLPPLVIESGWRWLLHCDAVATRCVVRVNGTEVARHTGGWTPFRADITRALHEDPSARNTLTLEVEELPGHTTQGFMPIIAPHFGGPWQPVRLIRVPATTLDEPTIHVLADAVSHDITVRAMLEGAEPERGLQFRVRVLDESGKQVASAAALVASSLGEDGKTLCLSCEVEDPALWSPGAPRLHDVEILLQPMEGTAQVWRRRVGFRTFATSGARFLLNGRPIALRGVLNWGFAPPLNRPSLDEAHMRAEIAAAKRMGFNLMKFCLWVPPRRYLELCDELGLCAWIEYPTWHAPWDAAHADDLAREYAEFFQHDRNHPSVLLRSLTCETGPGADIAVVRRMYLLAKAMIPGAVVEDDSSWIQWNRVHDFWDDHPYGNNHTWVNTLDRLRAHVAEHGSQPLALGEAFAADTWIDTSLLEAQRKAHPTWPMPHAFDAITRFEDTLHLQGAGSVAERLRRDSLRSAMLMRKFQLEVFRREFPNGAAVVSVMRDFPLASMGLLDAAGAQKWADEDWSFLGDTMLLVKSPGDRRAFRTGRTALDVRVNHAGPAPLTNVEIEIAAGGETQRVALRDLRPGHVNYVPNVEVTLPAVDRPTPQKVEMKLFAQGVLRARNSWTLWAVPEADASRALMAARHASASADLLPLGIAPRWNGEALDRVIVAGHMDLPLMNALENGARVLLLPDGTATAPKLAEHWFLRGGPVFPKHPLFDQLPPEFLVDLQHMDLAARVMPAPAWLGHTDPALLLWDTHDRRDVALHALVAETRVGSGRLLVSALEHRGDNAAGGWLLTEMVRHLLEGPAPRAALPAEAISAMRARCTHAELDLADAGWRFLPEPAGADVTALAASAFDDSAWGSIRAGAHWEGQGHEALDGQAWYRRKVTLPAEFAGREVWLTLDGADDAYEVFVNGTRVGGGGDVTARRTAFDEPNSIKLPVNTGEPFTLAIRVLDWHGAGGLHRPIKLATAPLSPAASLF